MSHSDPAQPTEPFPTSDLHAIRAFCESTYQASDRRLAQVMAHDWSAYPRVARAIGDIARPATHSGLATAALELLGRAVQDLGPNFPPRPGHVTPLEVFQLHVLEAQPWPSLQAMLTEQGRPHARGTLIRRQQEFLPYILQWAREPERGPAAHAARVSAKPASTRFAQRTGWRVMGALGVVLLASTILGVATTRPEWMHRAGAAADGPLCVVPEALQGIRIHPQLQSGGFLPAPYPPLPLPRVDGDRLFALVLEDEPGNPLLLLSWKVYDDAAPHFALWNPQTREMLWENRFLPPPQERLTHATVGPEVMTEGYWTAGMYHRGRDGTLGGFVAAVLHQKYSPTFVVFIDVDHGAVEGYYVHPGQLAAGLVIDIDQDATCELVLGGQDNALNRPAIVVLEPGPGRSAASTVMWNQSGAEGAKRRVFLPSWPHAQQQLAAPRLDALEMDRVNFDTSSRILTVGVGALGRTVYHARLGPGLVPDPQIPLILWDADSVRLKSLGVPESELDQLKSQFTVVERGGGV